MPASSAIAAIVAPPWPCAPRTRENVLPRYLGSAIEPGRSGATHRLVVPPIYAPHPSSMDAHLPAGPIHRLSFDCPASLLDRLRRAVRRASSSVPHRRTYRGVLRRARPHHRTWRGQRSTWPSCFTMPSTTPSLGGQRATERRAPRRGGSPRMDQRARVAARARARLDDEVRRGHAGRYDRSVRCRRCRPLRSRVRPSDLR